MCVYVCLCVYVCVCDNGWVLRSSLILGIKKSISGARTSVVGIVSALAVPGPASEGGEKTNSGLK